MTEDELSLRPSNNPLSSKSPIKTASMNFTNNQRFGIKTEINPTIGISSSVNSNNVNSSRDNLNGFVNGTKIHSEMKTESSKIDVKPVSNGVSQIKAEISENGHLDQQQPCSSKDDDNDQLKFKCPHTKLFIDAAYPDLDKVSREKIEEIIIDDMSLILFSTYDDYKVIISYIFI